MSLLAAIAEARPDLYHPRNGGIIHTLFEKEELFTDKERAELRSNFEALNVRFVITFKVKISDWRAYATSSELTGDPEVREAADCVYNAPYLHSNYAIYMRKLQDRCSDYLMLARRRIPRESEGYSLRSRTVSSLRKQNASPASSRPCDPRKMSDKDFDVWFTFRCNQTMNCETRIDANPACHQEMIRALSEGNADVIWGVMQRALCYLPLVACMRMLKERSLEWSSEVQERPCKPSGLKMLGAECEAPADEKRCLFEEEEEEEKRATSCKKEVGDTKYIRCQ